MTKIFKTPGVYINEKAAFPNSVVQVPTAIPAFIGYTEMATSNGQSLLNKPTRISSLVEYVEYFGKGFMSKFLVSDSPKGGLEEEVTINGQLQYMRFAAQNQCLLYNGLRLFYANGGGPCYIISVGTYGETPEGKPVKKEELIQGLSALEKEKEPTLIVMPDAVSLGEDCYQVYQEVLKHCAQQQNRFALFDIYNGYKDPNDFSPNSIVQFRQLIGTENLMYGAAYFPWLATTVVEDTEVNFLNLESNIDLQKLLPEEKAIAYVAEMKEKKVDENSEESTITNYHQGLMAVSPTYKLLMTTIRSLFNMLPSSSAMAGIYTMVDNSRGVWKSPANVSLNSVIQPAFNITHDDQEGMNVDVMSGKSINAIRSFVGEGTLVWGARTLDGNSQDWRYISVRRTIIMIEQSIKNGIQAFVFEPNDANTWASMKAMITNFLTEIWKQGGLAGAKPDDAFYVQVGLGITMTPEDILEGLINVTVGLAVVHTAEFIVITLRQKMQET